MSKYINRNLLGTCLGAGVLALMPFQTNLAADSQPVLEEIMVTANKRGALSIQDMAGSVQAISSNTLEDLNAEGFEDYIKLVPGLTSVSSGTGQSQIVIRGVNSGRVDHQNVQSKSLAGLYIDDTPISLAGFNPDLGLLDIERIEVLRGPQGTLYGASSMSGTVRVITKRPDTESVFGKINASLSDTQDGGINYGVNGSVNIPVSDSVALTLSGYYTDKDGYIDNIAPGGGEDYNEEETQGFRGVLAYYGNNFTATGTLMYHELEADGRPDQHFAEGFTDAVAAANQRNIDVTGQPLIGPVGIPGDLEAFKPGEDPFRNEFKGANLRLEWELEDFNIVSSTSYLDSETDNTVEEFFRGNFFLNIGAGGIGTPTGGVANMALENPVELETFVEEFRISSKADAAWQWVLGFYFEDYERTLGTRSLGGPGLRDQLIAAGQTLQTSNPDSILETIEISEIQQRAFFGEVALDLTETVELTLGARVFDYSATFEFGNHGLIFGSVNGTGTFTPPTTDESDWTSKAQLSWDVTDDAMLYFTYSEGFRLGGVNDVLPDVCQADLDALGVDPTFLSDSLDSYEVGAKTSWLDNRLTANLAVFKVEWTNIQQAFELNCGFFNTLNIGEIENDGIEGEFAFQATENLALRFGFAYVDSEVTEDSPISQDGDEPPYVSEFSASGSIVYDGIKIGDGEGFVRADVRHVGAQENEFSSNPSSVELDSYTVLDLTIGYNNGPWYLNFFAKNVTDEEIITNIDPDRAPNPVQATRGRPRTLGVSITRRFE